METKLKVAVITGAARGIGRAAAISLAKKNILTVIADIDIVNAQLVSEEIVKTGIDSTAYMIDVSRPEQIIEMTDSIIRKYGSIDILVNNAGILSKASIEDLDEKEWDRVMDINVKSAMFASQQAIKYMKVQKWGRIINISSMAGRMGGFSTGCAYSTSKAALLGMTMCIARKVASYNITVNAIAPGPTESDLFKGFSQEEQEKLAQSIPVGRMGKPIDIAEVVAFLASDAASFITGAVIDINGGMFIG